MDLQNDSDTENFKKILTAIKSSKSVSLSFCVCVCAVWCVMCYFVTMTFSRVAE